MKQVKIGKTYIDNLSFNECIENISTFIEANKKGYIVTPNVDHIVKLEKDTEFLRVYEKASYRVVDGMPLVWASKLLGTPFKEKLSGSDLFPSICHFANDKGYKIFFLGGLEGVAERAADNLCKDLPNLKVSGIYSPPFGFEDDEEENKKIINMINCSKAQILFVGVGAPKQEKWIHDNIEYLNINMAIGIGASFDFIAGTIKRAPKFIQTIGFEWMWRLMKEPKRLFKRYIIEDSVFIKIIFNQYRIR